MIIRQHNENVFDGQESTDFFFQYFVQIHSGVSSCISKLLERQIKFLLLTPC